MYEHCHISIAPRHLKIGKKRTYTVIKWIYLKAEAITSAIVWFEIVTKRYDELCQKISRSSLPS